MRGAPVRQADVFSAADAIAASGESPTIERVRRRIGRGSNSTIAPFLRAWREARMPVGPRGSLLEGAPGQLATLVGRIAEELRVQARREIEVVRAQAEQRGADLRAQAQEQGRADLEAAGARAASAEVRAERLAAENSVLQGVQAELSGRMAAFEASQKRWQEEVSLGLGRALGELRQRGGEGRAELLELAAALRQSERSCSEARAAARSARAELEEVRAQRHEAGALQRQEIDLLRERCEATERELRAERRAYRRLQRVLRRAGTLVATVPPGSA